MLSRAGRAGGIEGSKNRTVNFCKPARLHQVVCTSLGRFAPAYVLSDTHPPYPAFVSQQRTGARHIHECTIKQSHRCHQLAPPVLQRQRHTNVAVALNLLC